MDSEYIHPAPQGQAGRRVEKSAEVQAEVVLVGEVVGYSLQACMESVLADAADIAGNKGLTVAAAAAAAAVMDNCTLATATVVVIAAVVESALDWREEIWEFGSSSQDGSKGFSDTSPGFHSEAALARSRFENIRTVGKRREAETWFDSGL